MKADLRRKIAEGHPHKQSMVDCVVYHLGLLKRLFQRYHWSYIFSSDYPVLGRIYQIVTYAIFIVGIFGEFRP